MAARTDRNPEDIAHVQLWMPRDIIDAVAERAVVEERDRRTIWQRAIRAYLSQPYVSDTVDAGNQ